MRSIACGSKLCKNIMTHRQERLEFYLKKSLAVSPASDYGDVVDGAR